jgi:hypothetical protein
MLFGLNGFKGAGKDTIADYLVKEYDFTKLSFARLLKESAAALFGVPVDRWEEWKNDPAMEVLIQRNLNQEIGLARLRGEEPPLDLPHVRMTVREFLQRYGTEAHREIFGFDFWVDQALPEHANWQFGRYVFSDARFENELDRIRSLGGRNIQVLRPSSDTGDGHASEVRPPDHLIDYIIDNSGSMIELYGIIDSIMQADFSLQPKQKDQVELPSRPAPLGG